MHHRALYFAIILISPLLIACSPDDRTTNPVPPASSVPPNYPEKGVLNLRSLQSWDDDLLREAAEANLVILPIERCYSPEAFPKLERLRELNPDVAIVGDQGILGILVLWPDTAYLRTELPYVLDYWNTVRDDWAMTTTGDTFMIWRDCIFLNPVKNGALNRELLDETVDLIERYQEESGHPMDGMFHDYFMYGLNINPNIEDTVEGEVDFDGDGIIFADDEDEQAILYLYQMEFAREIRSRFGEDFIQIGNGRPPQEDPELAALLNGIFFERFPLSFWQSERDGFLRFLENQRDGYLSKARGRTWSILIDEWGNTSGGNMFNLVTSLLTGVFYAELYGSYIFSGWTLDVQPGYPRGSLELEGATDSVLTVKRIFSNGEARIRFSATGWTEEAVFDQTAVPSR